MWFCNPFNANTFEIFCVPFCTLDTCLEAMYMLIVTGSFASDKSSDVSFKCYFCAPYLVEVAVSTYDRLYNVFTVAIYILLNFMRFVGTHKTKKDYFE